jgi:hypothetical protein
MALWCQTWPDVPPGCSGSGWMWPGVARDLGSLAPRLPPRNLVSNANVRMPVVPDVAAGSPAGRRQPGYVTGSCSYKP